MSLLACASVMMLAFASQLLPAHAFAPLARQAYSCTKGAKPPSFTTALNAHATFGMGCFWKPSEDLLKVPGITSTTVGYTGFADATKRPPPTYDQVCYSRDPWVEAVRVDYDESQLSYNDVLDAFFDKQVPRLGSRQYASVIFVHDADQEKLAQEWKARDRQRQDGIMSSWTTIEQATPFYKAEEYHQGYWAKMRPRIAGMIALMAMGSGILDSQVPVAWQSPIHSTANAVVLAGLLFTMVERKMDTRTVLLD
jgi:peptide-methionine (S)-S-oxide reductase